MRKGVSIAESLKEPSKADAKALSKLFPSSRKSEKRSSSLVFDPTSECVVAPQQRKKKRSLSLSRSNKPFKISCFLIRSLARGVPRGNYRADLRRCGNEAQVQMMRNMTKERVKVTILQAFNHISNYSFLMCSQDGKLHIAENQCPNGENILQAVGGGKSSLYILENVSHDICDDYLIICCDHLLQRLNKVSMNQVQLESTRFRYKKNKIVERFVGGRVHGLFACGPMLH